MNEFEGAPRTWPPLGLPTGSVRALLTLIVVAVVTLDLARDRSLDILWTETLLIALAHYFTTRRFVALPPAVVQRLEAEGVIERESQPLFLPQYTIRLAIMAAFIGLGVYLHEQNRLWDSRALPLLTLVGAYFLGALVRGITRFLFGARERRPSRLWADLRALIAIGALLAAALPEFVQAPQVLPPEFHKIALGFMLFYFGSR